MMKISGLIGLLLLASVATAQKVKYKDIFPDLEARKFNKAEPLLKTFLANEKNADHANANYQMGLINEAHFLLQDIVVDTTTLFAFGDQVLEYYRKSIPLITEKELRKNDNYYQSFYRRDLRTGEFGIKPSDVHLDIEKKIEAIVNRLSTIRSFHAAVSELTRLEAEMLVEFHKISGRADSYNDYLLKANLDNISLLGDLQATFKAFDDKANETLKVGQELQAENYFSSVEYQDIVSFGELNALFPSNNTKIATWQFSAWASTAKSTLNSEIFVMKNELIEMDLQLRKAANVLKSRKPSPFPSTIKKTVAARLAKYDPRALPMQILKARIRENSIRVMSDTLLNPVLLDSAAIALQLTIADSVLTSIDELTALLTIDNKKIIQANKYYKDYFDQAFGGTGGVLNYKRNAQSWVDQLKSTWTDRLAFWDMRNNWGTSETDTIPLHIVDTTYHGNFVTKGFLSLPDNEIISWGIKRDSLNGFIAMFGTDRKLIWQNRFESDLFSDGVAHSYITDTLASDTDQFAFYLYDPETIEETNLTIVNSKLEGDLNWSISTTANKKPTFTTYSHAIQETTIFLYPQESYPLTTGELGYIIIDRNGEIR